MTGWPSTIKEILQVLQPYWTFHEELTIEDGLILKGTRIVVPNKQWETILHQIHDSHLGLQKCKLHAMQSVYWPGINDQLKQLVLNCQLCLKYLISKNKPDTSSSLEQEIPLLPWTKLATDIFPFEGDLYLVLVDYTSHFPIVCKLKSMTAQHIFAKYGWPNTIVSDNGPCYASEAFQRVDETIPG